MALFNSVKPIAHYFSTIKKMEFFTEIVIPILLTIPFVFLFSNAKNYGISKFTNFIFTFSAIMIGFSITTITLLTTSSNENIEETKANETDRKLYGSKITLYQITLIKFTYCLFVEFLVLALNLGFVLFYHLSCLKYYVNIYYLFNIFFLSHIIILSYLNITHLYYIFIKKNKD